MRMQMRAVALAVGLGCGMAAMAATSNCPSANGGLLQQASLQGSPLDALPPHITQLSDRGQRAAWSPDGKRVAYIDGGIGDVFELNVETRAVRNLTAAFSAAGFMRAQYLRNGDLLMCGPLTRDPAVEDDGRFRGLLWIQRAPFDQAPVSLGESCWEGYAADPDSDRIAWTVSNIAFDSPDVVTQALFGTSQIYVGRLQYTSAGPRIVDKALLLDRSDIGLSILEAQDFRRLPGGGKELLFSVYVHRGGEVLGINLQTGVVADYSLTPVFEEGEGVDPTGTFELVEHDPSTPFFPRDADIWRLQLDGTARYQRMTFFSDYCGYGASNPVVSPDGKRFAFQLKTDGSAAGAGSGLLLFDLQRWNAENPGVGEPAPNRLPPKRYRVRTPLPPTLQAP